MATNRCVVRNTANRRGNLGDRYRHNERHNSCYGNGDIQLARSPLNVHFKQCNGSYAEAFDKLLDDGVISTRGLGKDPKIVDELVFDVNSAYFEDRGGYEYAKAFFSEAYRLAVKEAGGEQYVLSAVMHADERNAALSEKLGRDVYHYHLHVVYVPVVDKEIRWSKRCKNPALVGTIREVIKQVSHSKKWPRAVQHDEGGEVVRNKEGKAVLVNSYSLLQDRFYEHMRSAGFTDFERGERGSTEQHLSTLDYKIKQDEARAAALGEHLDEKQRAVSALDKRIAIRVDAQAKHGEIDSLPRRKLTGKMELSPEDWETVSELAKKGVTADVDLSEVKRMLAVMQQSAIEYSGRFEQLKDDTWEYRMVAKHSPERVRAALLAIEQEHREDRSTRRQPERKKSAPER